VVLITTADAAVGPMARRLVSLSKDWSGKVVLHTCGSLPANVLRPLRRRGAAIGSLHPFQTVPSPAAGVENLLKCFWALEGDPAARKVAARWVRDLEGVSFRISSSQKTLYHLAAFLVCPTTVTLMDRSLRLLRRSHVPPRMARLMLGKFVAETAGNFVRLGARRALTGPAVRGDWRTIRGHLRALRRVSPEVIPLYRELLRAMLRLAGRRLPSRLL